MGRSSTFYCKTCKCSYYLGYGSYGTWLDGARTVEEYDQCVTRAPDDIGQLKKNVNVRRCLEAHAGHDHECYSSDYTHEADGKLYGQFGTMGADVVMIDDYGDWTHEDLT